MPAPNKPDKPDKGNNAVATARILDFKTDGVLVYGYFAVDGEASPLGGTLTAEYVGVTELKDDQGNQKPNAQLKTECIADAKAIDRKMRSLKPINRKCKLSLSGGVDRPPMERTKAVAELFRIASELANKLGWKLQEAAVGGGSDGNLTAALGIPTLDGLGGVGDGAHATHEFITTEELPKRAALVAGLIESV